MGPGPCTARSSKSIVGEINMWLPFSVVLSMVLENFPDSVFHPRCQDSPGAELPISPSLIKQKLSTWSGIVHCSPLWKELKSSKCFLCPYRVPGAGGLMSHKWLWPDPRPPQMLEGELGLAETDGALRSLGKCCFKWESVEIDLVTKPGDMMEYVWSFGFHLCNWVSLDLNNL